MERKQNLLEEIGKFTWFYNHKFFVETKLGDFIWSDPEYPEGDNTFTPYLGGINQFLKEQGVSVAKYKGEHQIKIYCGTEIKLIEEK